MRYVSEISLLIQTSEILKLMSYRKVGGGTYIELTDLRTTDFGKSVNIDHFNHIQTTNSDTLQSYKYRTPCS